MVANVSSSSFTFSTLSEPDWPEQALANHDPEVLRDSFATTLRRRRARQRATCPALRWQPRWSATLRREPTLLGAEAEALQPHTALAMPSPGKGSRRRSTLHTPHERDDDILSHACASAMQWQRPLRVMVTLGDPVGPNEGFVERLNGILEATHLPPTRLDLSLNEASLANGARHITYSLAILRDYGVGIWLNRFGHDVSSLTLLRDYAASGLLSGVRLDGGLLVSNTSKSHDDVHLDIPAALDETACAFFQGTIAAIHGLGLSVQLTDVVGEAMVDFAMQTGCQEISGPYCTVPEAQDVLNESAELIA